MKAIIEFIGAFTPIGIGICSLLGVGSVGKIIIKIIEYKNDEKIRKEKRLSIVNGNFSFYKKLFDKIAFNVKLWQTEQIKQNNINSCDFSIKMTITDFDTILGESIVNFNSENRYLDIEDQISLKTPLQARELY
jgi:hypothetical protein